jgi:hypothetical protein
VYNKKPRLNSGGVCMASGSVKSLVSLRAQSCRAALMAVVMMDVRVCREPNH